jgi:UDP-glucose 4-epimerase
MKILITGVAGLLGSNLATYILNKGHEVIGIDNLSGGQLDFVDPRVIFYQCDLCDTDTVSKAFAHFPQIVFHLAAYAAVSMSPFIRKFNYQNNIIATAQVINMCIYYDVGRLVFTSSMDVYGDNLTPFTEDQIPRPQDPYGIAKYACELDIESAGHDHGLDWCILRPHNVYGIQQNIWDRFRNVLGIWMWKILNDQPLTIYGDGLQVRAFSYIDDILEPMWQAGVNYEASKQIINLGGVEPISIEDAAQLVKEVTKTEQPIIYLEPRREVKVAYSSYDKSQTLLGFEHRMGLRSGVERMWEWARAQQPRPQTQYPCPLEIKEGLYSYWR